MIYCFEEGRVHNNISRIYIGHGQQRIDLPVYATNDICYTMPNFFLLFCLETADKKIVDFKHLPYLSVSNECFCMDTADSTFSIISRKCAPWASVYSLIPSNFMSPLIVVAFMIKVSSDMPSAQTTACSGISLNRYHQKKV